MSKARTESASTCPSAGRDTDRQFTSTLANGMALLSCFREGDTRLANRDFVARTGLAKANVSRLTFTLVTLGFLRHDARSGHYLLGSPVLSMGYPLLAGMHIRQIARPYMREMADELGATVSMGVRDRAQMLYVETSRSAKSTTRLADIGTARPLLDSAMGLAWLGTVSAYERERAMNQALVAADRHSDKDYVEHIARGLKGYAENGYASIIDKPGSSLTVAVALRSAIASEIVVFDCALLLSKRLSVADLDALGHRLILTARSIEGACSMR